MRVFLGLGLQPVARDHRVDEAERVHLLRGERTPGEQHLAELAIAHRLDPGPQARAPAGVAERGVAEQRVVGTDHQVGVGRLVEVPAVAIALHFDDADLLERLQRPRARARGAVVVGKLAEVAIAGNRRVLHVFVVDAEFIEQRNLLDAKLVAQLLARDVGAGAEVVALGADDENLHVVVDVRLLDQLGIEPAHARSRRVHPLGSVERQIGDLALLVLPVVDELPGILDHLPGIHGHRLSPREPSLREEGRGGGDARQKPQNHRQRAWTARRAGELSTDRSKVKSKFVSIKPSRRA